MEIEFVNRKEELSFLNKKWEHNDPQLIIVYGKRRVGKTELCLHFAKDKPHLYFLCERIPIRLQLKKLTEAVAGFFNDEFLPKEGLDDWEKLFKYLSLKCKERKMILIIDEFSYLAETDDSVPSSFQKAWDLYIKASKIFLILSGSSISMMEKSALFYNAPLYGRRSGQILVKQFKFKDLRDMFKGKSFEDILTIYAVVGGTPMYLNKFKRGNYLDVINDEIFSKGQPLYEEVDFILREELKEPRNYFAILEAISLGKHRLSEIINETGFDKGLTSRYVSILNQLQITKKDTPVTEKMPEKSRNGLYVIDDNFIGFWFRFIFRNKSLLEEGKKKEVTDKLKKSLIELQAKAYESIAGEILIENLLNLNLNFQSYGRWWHKDKEIDLVTINASSSEILFGEVKWSNKKVGVDIYENLKNKSRLVPWGVSSFISEHRGRGGMPRKEYFALFSKSGFTDAMTNIAAEEGVLLFEKDRLMSILNR
jgi:hypothetical protein